MTNKKLPKGVHKCIDCGFFYSDDYPHTCGENKFKASDFEKSLEKTYKEFAYKTDSDGLNNHAKPLGSPYSYKKPSWEGEYKKYVDSREHIYDCIAYSEGQECCLDKQWILDFIRQTIQDERQQAVKEYFDKIANGDVIEVPNFDIIAREEKIKEQAVKKERLKIEKDFLDWYNQSFEPVEDFIKRYFS